MHTQLIAMSLMAGAIAMPSFADDVYASGEVGYFASVPSGPSTATRDEVVAELMKSMQEGPVVPEPSTLTRAEVVAELMKALREGTVPPTAEHADIGAVAVTRAAPLPEAQPTLAAR